MKEKRINRNCNNKVRKKEKKNEKRHERAKYIKIKVVKNEIFIQNKTYKRIKI